MKRLYETVTVREHNGAAAYDMRAHVSQLSQNDGSDPLAPNRTVSTTRMVYGGEHTLRSGQQIEYRGQVWTVDLGEQVHTRRGRFSHKSVELKRTVG